MSGSGVSASGRVVTITAAGTYVLTGTLDYGQLVVDSDAAEAITLVFQGVSITNTTGAPVYVSSAEKTVIILAAGTTNTLTDGDDYVFPEGEDEPDAALFSKDDLVIQGSGSLTVNANYKSGIVSKDDLTIAGGVISVTAAKHALKGKDAIVITGGTFTIVADGDGLQSDNDEDADKGYIAISGGTFTITAANDGIQAETELTITGGAFTIEAGGGSGVTTEDSCKGLKAGGLLSVSGGTFTLNTADDAIHSDTDIAIHGGTFSLATAADGVHADGTVTIDGGEITVSECYEGIEGSVIVINDGTIHVTSSDDGINVAGDLETSSSYYLEINGGYIVVDAAGDGLDANGRIIMTGGVVLVHGPTGSDNGAIDYDFTFNQTGGILAAAGSSGMAQAPSATSSQYSVLVNLSAAQQAQTLFHIETQSGGAEILTFAPEKQYQSVVFSLPALSYGTAYRVYTGGSSTGTATDGLYAGGTYTSGTLANSFTISSMVTTVGDGGTPQPPF